MVDETKGGGERGSRRRRGRGSKGSKGGDGDSRSKDGGDGDSRKGGRGRSRRGRRSRGGGDVEELGASSGIDVIDRPSEGRPRKSGLEPGLTLKDLLPFLRPPKTVLVLGASTGAGHNRTASALVEAFKGVDRNLVVRHHDALDLIGKDHDSSEVRRMLEDLSRSEGLFGTPFDTIEGGQEDPGTSSIDELLPNLFAKKMDQMLVDKRPDHVVCTHWLPLRHMEKLKEEERFTASVTAAIPDPDVCERWVSDLVAHYLVSEDGLKARLQRAGVDPSMITVTGTPVSPNFVEVVDRDAVGRELGIRVSNPTVLLRPGGIGSTERIVDVVKGILEAHEPVNILVLAGKNEDLRAALEGIEVEGGSQVKPFGFVQNIHELMGVADLLISRASPHTMAEACASGLPALLLRPSPGIEERMADRLLRVGCAYKAYGERDLEFLVRELLKNRRYLKEMQDAAEKRRRPDAAHLAVERISKIVK